MPKLPGLIVSDIDGTLLPYGGKTLPEELFPLIRRLRAAGFLFCPASGRQYHSLRHLFAPVADELAYLCENGAVVMGPGSEETAPLLCMTAMPRDGALALCRAIAALPGCEAFVSGVRVGYVSGCAEEFGRLLTQTAGNLVRRIPRFEDVPEEMVKVSAFCPNGTQPVRAVLGPRFAGRFRMAEGGPTWLDFTCADKGIGLRGLCAALGVPPEETAAFGDNWNDVPMLELVGYPYIMSTADPALLERFPRHCAAVCEELRRILALAKNGAGAEKCL